MVVLYKQLYLGLKVTLIFVASVTLFIPLSSQTDTLFWFAAPDFTSGHGEVPIYLRLSTLEDTATVVLSQPAQEIFKPITIQVAPNSSYSVDLSPYLALIENNEAGKVLNKGLLIESTSKINVYYENSSFWNPEIFTLKGQKALGKEFIIPMQDLFSNSAYSPLPYASFDIVATEDNTLVTILPSHDIVGYDANKEFTIELDKGQTFVCQARQRTAGFHLGGTVVNSDKMIAITIKDDSMGAGAIYGGCSDLGGDQITPIEYLGHDYVSIPGSLNGPNDVVFIYGVYDSTDVYINGDLIGTIDRQEQLKNFSFGQPMLIYTSKPTYALHMSGFGCELGLDQLPPVDPCYGSRILSVNRSTNQAFFLNILVYEGMKDSFLFNGSKDIINGSDFTEVPGTSGDIYYGRIEIPLSQLGAGKSAIVKNTEGPFHLAIIHGGRSTGTMYGYFSDYGYVDLLAQSVSSCDFVHLEVDSTYSDFLWSTGDTTASIDIFDSGIYKISVTSKNGCKTTDETYVEIKGDSRSTLDFEICESDTIIFGSEEFHSNNRQGEIVLSGEASNGCDSIIDIQINFLSNTRFSYDDIVCPDEFIIIESDTFNIHRPSGRVVLYAANNNGCDSIIDVDLSFYEIPLEHINILSCYGDTAWIEGVAFHNGYESDTLLLKGRSQYNCDSLLLVQYEELDHNVEYIYPSMCIGDTLEIEEQLFYGSHDYGEVILEGKDINGCDSTIVVNLEWFPESELVIFDTLCPGEEMFVHNTFFSEENRSGILVLEDAGYYGCDSMIQIELFYPENRIQIVDTFEINYGQSVFLEAQYDGDFSSWDWSPMDYLDCSDCDIPLSSPLNTIEYTLESIDIFGCRHFVKTKVIVNKERRIYIPNVFSPNGDGMDDAFTVYGNYFLDIIETFEIYDRWGELIAKLDNAKDGSSNMSWDGNFMGDKVLTGVYCYKINVKYLDGSHELFVGDITVVR